MSGCTHLVFVYGTLTDPERVRRVLASADAAGGQTDRVPTGADRSGRTDERFAVAGPAILEGLTRAQGRYPTLVPGDGVDGRLLAVDETGLAALDAYEGVGRGLYVRVAVPLDWNPADGVADRAEGDDRGLPSDDSPADDRAPASDDASAEDRGLQSEDGALAGAHTLATADTAWTYVGDPDRLGIDADWPGDGPFERRVRRYVADRPVSVSHPE